MSVLLCAPVGKRISVLTVRCASVCIERVKWFAFLLLGFVFVAATSCTTLVNRRDLYSPEPSPDSLEAARQWYGVTTTSTTTTIRTQRAAGDIARRIFVTREQTEGSHYRVGEPALSTQETCRLGSLRDGSDNTGYVLAERKIHFYSRHVCPVDARCFGQPALALRVFRRHQMASRGTRSQDLSTGSNLEAFRHCFSRFAACNGLRHTA